MNCPECDMFSPPGTTQCDCGYLFTAAQRRPKHQAPSRAFGPINIIIGSCFLMSILAWCFAHFYQAPLPRKDAIRPELLHAPIQTESQVPDPFPVEKNGMNYRVEPKYHYALQGLVVSTHDADSLSDVLHEHWKDYLNIMDLCVIWGPNIENEVYRRIQFTSGNFTCFCRWFDEETGRMFHFDALSNNHLLTADRSISKAVRSVQPGDQISLEGYLAHYQNPAYGFSRGTSTNRTDTGDGACETIYLTDFAILKRRQPYRPWLKSAGFIGVIGSVAAFFLLPFIIKH